ncbi:hypothetical protein DXA97_13910 [Clostridium sp. OF09-36]|nr:hypothetical protein DXA97_13910 [Clostridium sp. OF09-36]
MNETERLVMKLYGEGKSVADIAGRLGKKESTVYTYLTKKRTASAQKEEPAGDQRLENQAGPQQSQGRKQDPCEEREDTRRGEYKA